MAGPAFAPVKAVASKGFAADDPELAGRLKISSSPNRSWAALKGVHRREQDAGQAGDLLAWRQRQEEEWVMIDGEERSPGGSS